MDPLEKLYQNYNVLSDAKDDILKYESQFLEIINAVKGSSTEKRLASQFISKFYKDFPNLQELAVNSLFDLCEDDDVEIRKQVIKDLPSICKDHQENVPKITDILCQLLANADDTTEIHIIHLSLISLCKISPKFFLTGLFAQIENNDETIKERAIQFLHSKIKTLPEDFWNKENEEFFLNECKKILVNSSKERFTLLMSILSNLKICKRISGQQILLDMVNQNIHLEQEINPEDKENLDTFAFYLKYAVGCFSHYVFSNQYVEFICTKLLSRHQLIDVDGQLKDNFEILNILQALGDITAYIQPTVTTSPINLQQCETIVFNKLLGYLPEIKSDATPTTDYKFDCVEALLFAFHNLGKKNNEQIINDIGGDEILKEFKKRLQQLGLACQERIKVLQTSVRTISETPTSPKGVALKCIHNIQAIIKDMFYLKPVFKVSLAPSWKFGSASTVVNLNKNAQSATPANEQTNGNGLSSEQSSEANTSNKRKLITAPEKDPEDAKRQKKIYTPPSGKYSNKSNFRSSSGPSNRNGGNRNFNSRKPQRGGGPGRNSFNSRKFNRNNRW